MANAVSRLGFAAAGVVLPAVLGLYACGSSSGNNNGKGGDGGVMGVLGPDSSYGNTPSPFADAGGAMGSFTTPDCNGCTFPPKSAPPCASSAPPIKIVYPTDGILVPPNMGQISVQWTPFGTAYKDFEVDFTNGVTDTRVIAKCSMQTIDTGQPNTPSGGCELVLSSQVWNFLADANRGGDAVSVTVRGTTDGMCAATSANTVNMSFAEEDLIGAIYYWKSTVSAAGTGGQIWSKTFGDPNPEQQVTGLAGSALSASCNGCHALSRDGVRMVVYSDDNDSDDEYSDVTGSLIDMTSKMPIGTAYAGRGTGQPPGFSTFSPDHQQYLTSNGTPNGATNVFALWSGNAGMQTATVSTGGTGMDRPTMPDWSPDGKTVVYVLPTRVASWDNGRRNDDAHIYGGSLMILPYMGAGQFGTPVPFMMSGGENNYYPSYSPDDEYIIFDRAPHDTSAGALEGCVTSPHPACPNDSFSNPAARLMLTGATANSPIDLEAANGSPAGAPEPLSNSWPRWAPFVQTYRGDRLLWVAFSSTRDYGIRVRNHKPGMYQCYPADSVEDPAAPHMLPFAPQCEQPQLWMAPIVVTEGGAGHDPSRPAFWLPFQDITTHNHTPQWTQEVATTPPTGTCITQGGDCKSNPAACCAGACNYLGQCAQIVM